MINARTALRFQDKLPKATDVVVIGGGVIGVFALSALLLAFCVKDPH